MKKASDDIIAGVAAISVGDPGTPTPSGWRRVLLTDIARLESGHTPSRRHPDYWDGDVPWVGIVDARAHHAQAIHETAQTVTAKGLANSAARLLPTGSVCLSRTASVGYVTVLGRPMATSQDFVNWICGAELDPWFLAYALLAEGIHLRNFGKGTVHTTIYFPEALALHITLPRVAEQRRIVAAIEQHLSDVDAGAAALERVLANLKRYRASVLKAACEGRLVPTEAELARKDKHAYEPADVLLERMKNERRTRWEASGNKKGKYVEPALPETDGLPELPEGWVWATVDAVGDVLLGRQRAPQYLTGKWSRPYLRVANVKDGRIDFDDVEEMDFEPAHYDKYKLAPGDILISEGQSLERVGESAIYRGGVEGLCFQKTLHRFRPVPGGPAAEFAQIVFRSHVKSGLFKKLASITTNIAHLTLEKFEAAPFPLPPAAEQQRIVAEVERLLSAADDVERTVRAQLARASRLRQSVLKRAFDGKLVPQDPNDEPASVMLTKMAADRAAVPPTSERRRSRTREKAKELST